MALGIRDFLHECRQAGRSRASAYRHYVLGLDKNGDKIDLEMHMQRGANLHKLTEAWLNTWGNTDDTVQLVALSRTILVCMCLVCISMLFSIFNLQRYSFAVFVLDREDSHEFP